MKRWPGLVSFVLFIGLCVSVTFWSMQLFKPAARPVSMPKLQAKLSIDSIAAAIGLFGGRAAPVAATSNFQLRGIVFAKNPRESVAILVADGKPAQELRVNEEVTPGVVIKEIHPQYVLLQDAGVTKRVELPTSAPQSKLASPVATVTQQPQAMPPPPAQMIQQVNPPSPPPNISLGTPPAIQEGEPAPPSPNQPAAHVGNHVGRNGSGNE